MSRLVCLGCYNIFTRRRMRPGMPCPIHSCSWGKLVELDDAMVVPVIALNKIEQVSTMYCCSGHLEESLSSFSPYIVIMFYDEEVGADNIKKCVKFCKDVGFAHVDAHSSILWDDTDDEDCGNGQKITKICLYEKHGELTHFVNKGLLDVPDITIKMRLQTNFIDRLMKVAEGINNILNVESVVSPGIRNK